MPERRLPDLGAHRLGLRDGVADDDRESEVGGVAGRAAVWVIRPLDADAPLGSRRAEATVGYWRARSCRDRHDNGRTTP
jgi:hypothetical protein